MVKGTNEDKYRIHVMKAIGWYIDIHKGIKRNEIAEKMNLDAAVISRETISVKSADEINENNCERLGKRLIEMERAVNICKSMGTTLESVLYYYQFRNVPDISIKIDKIEKLTNQLTNLSNEEDIFDFSDVISACPVESIGTNNLISNVGHPDFKPLFGKYYCYFSSTSSDEAGKKYTEEVDRFDCDSELSELFDCMTDEYIYCGIMDIKNDDEFQDKLCHIDFKFLANVKERIIKKYSGVLTLSAKTNAVYGELVGKEQGEKTYFIFEKQDLGKEQSHVQCCMAMVLTYSSKVHRRRPCCERMIISNSIIGAGTEEYEVMKAYLRMNDKVIRITQWGYEELIKDINRSAEPELIEIAEKFPDLQSLSGKTVPVESCAFIPESVIYALHTLTPSQQRKFEVLLRIHSIAPWYTKTKPTKQIL